MARCSCGAQVEDGQRFCTVCGREVAVQPAPTFCTNCGARLEAGQAFCTSCGAKAIAAPASPASAPAPNQAPTPAPAPGQYAAPAPAPAPPADNSGVAKTAIIAVAIIAVALIAAIAIYFVVAPHSTTSTANNSNVATQNASNASSSSNASNTGSSSSTNTNANTGNSSSSTSGKSVSVTVKTKSGGTLTGTVHQNSQGYIIADSSTHQYTESEIRALGLNAAELCIARNEIYARHGYDFSNSGLQSYFNSCSWYTNSGSQPSLTAGGVEEKNAVLLLEISKSSSSTSDWTELATS